MRLRMLLQAGLLLVLLVARAGAGPTCGGPNQFCCPGDQCQSGLACVEAMGGGTQCVPCGGTDGPCCVGGTPCTGQGLACVDGTCKTCGATGLGCCDSTPSCAEGYICQNMDCARCGQEAGQPCCGEGSEDQCREGLLCNGQLCKACGDIGLQCCANDTCPEDGMCINGTCHAGPASATAPAPTMGSAGLALTAMFLVGIGAFRTRRSKRGLRSRNG